MEFCHIVPKKFVNLVNGYNRHLVLAHLIESDPEYVNLYKTIVNQTGATLIMDNSAYEMYKQGRPMFESDKLIELANKVGADYIVLSDYPKQDWMVTRDKAIEMIPEIKGHGFNTFYVPQSELGDIDGWCESVRWALNNKNIDLIGMSILGCPIAMGIEEGTYGNDLSGMIRLQRFLARYRCYCELEKRGIIDFDNPRCIRRFHNLGMQDGPGEIELMSRYHKMIASWDTSSGCWHAINHVLYDHSPTMLKNGKINSEVDFDWNETITSRLVQDIKYNFSVIDDLVENLNLLED